MRVLLVEDDYLEESLVRRLLTGRPFRIPDWEIETISTEEEFYNRAPAIARSSTPPELVIMDVMMRWTDPGPRELDLDRIPDTVKKEGPYRAGLRCAELLDELNPSIPILFYTILEREDLDSDLFRRRGPDRTVDHVQKKTAQLDYARKDCEEDPLVEKLRQFLNQSKP